VRLQRRFSPLPNVAEEEPVLTGKKQAQKTALSPFFRAFFATKACMTTGCLCDTGQNSPDAELRNDGIIGAHSMSA
jgi:hypothetical protein